MTSKPSCEAATMRKFSMDKWYMDCITMDGNAFIGYSAVLSWGKLTLQYSSQLIYTKEGGVEHQGRIGKTKFPDFHLGTLRWGGSNTHSKGTWESVLPDIEDQLLVSDQGDVDWYCAQPLAKATVISFNQKTFHGLGYTEKLLMTIKPWELPINELRWGRFLSEHHSIIWISWIGPKPLSLVYVNGKKIPDATISDTKIESLEEKLELILDQSVTMRSGSLITTAFSTFPWLSKFFPSQILSTFECKWRSKGKLKINDLEQSPGWAIHELVKWT